MAAQYQVGDRVSSTEYNPSYFSRKTKELFTPGQGPALAARAAGPLHTSPRPGHSRPRSWRGWIPHNPLGKW